MLKTYRILASMALLLAISACETLPGSNDTEAPTIIILGPSANSTALDSLVITVNATDNVGIARVEIFLTSSIFPVGVDSVAPYIIRVPLADIGSGAFQFYAKALDAAGNETVSDPVAFTALNTPGLKFLGRLAINGSARDVVASGNMAYVAAGSGGVIAVDISNVMLPTTVTQYNSGDFVSGVALGAQRLFAAAGDQGVLALSTATADTLIAVAQLTAQGIDAQQLAARDSSVSVAGGTGGLFQLNASAADSLIELGKFDQGGDISDVELVGPHAYTAEGGEGMRVIDITNPDSLNAVYQFVPSTDAWDLYVRAPWVYLADGVTGVRSFNAATPSAPVFLHTFTSGALIQGVSGSGQWVYAAAGAEGVIVINALTPGAMTAATNGTFNTSGFAYKVAAHNGYVLVADGDFLTILKYVP